MEKLKIATVADMEEFERVPIGERMEFFNTFDLIKHGTTINPEALAISFFPSGEEYANPNQVTYRDFLAQEELAADPSLPLAYTLLGALHLFPKREYEKAIELGEKAVAMDPNDANAKALLAGSLVFAGRSQEAIVLFNKAMRLMPYYPPCYARALGLAYHLTGENEKAVEVLKSSVEWTPDNLFPHVRLAAVYAEMDRMEEAHAAAAEVLRINPKFTVSNWAMVQLFKDPAVKEHRAELMRKAGLPE